MSCSSLQDYPDPLKKERGQVTDTYTYRTMSEAFHASLVAEQIAEQRWMQGVDFGYTIPGRITENPDGTFTVVVA